MSGVYWNEDDDNYYIADTIDFERGVYVKSINNFVIDGSIWTVYNGTVLGEYTRFGITLPEKAMGYKAPALCDRSIRKALYDEDSSHFYVDNNTVFLFIPTDLYSQYSNVSEYFADYPTKFKYILATPIETPLYEEEMAQYQALHSNYPVTTVLNDSGANMEVKYAADTNNYIEQNFVPVNKYNSLITRIEALESAIVTT